jgi:hypothetical protein
MAEAAVGNVGNTDGPAVYLALGHGDEDVDLSFESRIEIPAGYTLITLAECGTLLKTGAAHPIMDLFSRADMKQVIQNPQEYKEALSFFAKKTRINIYTSGDKIPDLGLHLFLDWTVETPGPRGATPGLKVQRSGVYKFPVTDNLDMRAPTNENNAAMNSKYDFVSAQFHRFTKKPIALTNKEQLLKVYENSVLPTVDDINDLFTDKTELAYDALTDSTYFKLSTVFERLGPGIYYFLACRGVRRNHESRAGRISNKIVLNTLKKRPNNSIQYYPSIFPRVLEIATNVRRSEERRPSWAPAGHMNLHLSNASNTLNEPRFMKHMYRKVMRTRRNSLGQQAKYAIKAVESESGAAGGAGAEPSHPRPRRPALLTNFPPLNERSSLEEVLSELPHLRMKGITDETMLAEYQTMIERYPAYKVAIQKDLVRVLVHTLPSIERLRSMSLEAATEALNDRLTEIRRVYEAMDYPELIPIITERIRLLKRALLRSRGGGSGGAITRRNRPRNLYEQ